MDCFFTTLMVGGAIYLLVCLAIIVFSDSDIITSIYARYGKDPEKEFDGKVIWITGASSGIGEGIAKQMAKCSGSKIILSARRKDELERVKKECLKLNRAKKPESILVLPLDMLNYESHAPALNKLLATFGKLDILVSNAGRDQHAKWHEIDIAVDKELFELNVFSVVHMNRIVVKYFMGIGSGHLAITSSVASKISPPEFGSYPASKAAINTYFETLRNEVSRNIAITLILPGPVISNIQNEAFTAAKDGKMMNAVPRMSNRMSAERCGFLCSVALANRLDESWIAPPFILIITYLTAYQPFLYAKLMQLFAMTGLRERIKKRMLVDAPH